MHSVSVRCLRNSEGWKQEFIYMYMHVHVHVVHIVYNDYIYTITPCTCARLKQSSCHYRPHKHCQISKSRYLSVSGQCYHDVGKVKSRIFAFDKYYESYKLCLLIGHTYQPHLYVVMSCAYH